MQSTQGIQISRSRGEEEEAAGGWTDNLPWRVLGLLDHARAGEILQPGLLEAGGEHCGLAGCWVRGWSKDQEMRC
jgi:hypothetical protein